MFEKGKGAKKAGMSAEQGAVVDAFERGEHVSCTAVAGAGKTTTMLMCAARCPERACLLLTYNKRLQSEVAARAPASVRAMTYHAACGAAYGRRVFTDEELEACVARAPAPSLRFDVVMLDEAQDTTPHFHALVSWLLRDNRDAQVLVVGDARQCINEYRGASAEYLRDAERFFTPEGSARAWSHLVLRGSYRLTPATASFVNAQLYNADVITGLSANADRKPVYVATGTTWEEKADAWLVAARRACAAFGAGNVYVLAPSVRNLNKTPLGAVVRGLRDIAIAVSDDDHRPCPETERGKLVVTTYNQSKGSERDCVLVVGMDETYFAYYDQAHRGREAPNTMSVAATRARKLLVVLAARDATLRSVDAATLGETARVFGVAGSGFSPSARPREQPTVTSVVRYASAAQRAVARGHYASGASPLTPALAALGEVDQPPLVRAFDGRFGAISEDFAFAYGQLAPALAEYELTGTVPLCLARAKVPRREREAFAPAVLERLDAGGEAPSHWLARCVVADAVRNGQYHYPRQVAEYAWADEPRYARFLREATRTARAAAERVSALAGLAGEFEVPVECAVGGRVVTGAADFVAGEHVLEFKLGEATTDACFQLAMYLAMRGGGEGDVVSLVHRACTRVTVDASACAALLAAVV
jgi:hypothetical protein